MWYNDNELLRGLGQALSLADEAFDANLYFRKPQRYNDEFLAWESCEFPTSEEDDGWDEFTEMLAGEDDDEEDDDETE